MIKESIGDVLQAPEEIIAHQTNCKGVMGAGVALQIRNKLLRKVDYDSYHNLCLECGNTLLGSVQFLHTQSGKIIANVFGEDIPTGQGLDTNYDALKEGLKFVEEYARICNKNIAIPGLMGCGLAGGDWNIVYNDILVPIFKKSASTLHIVFFLEEDYNKWHNL